MTKKYILDTSTLISDCHAFKYFYDSHVVLPITVLNELDNLKKLSNEVGKNARVCIKLIDEISNKGDLSKGVEIENNIKFFVDAHYYNSNDFLGFGDASYGDTQILICAYVHLLEHSNQEVFLVSNDINLRIKAKARGLKALAHEPDKSFSTDMYSGVQTIINEDAGMELQKYGFIDPKRYNFYLFPNECVLFQNVDKNVIAMGRQIADDKLVLIKKIYPWGLSPRNKEQVFAIDLLMDKNVDLVTLSGTSGSGKSITAQSVGLELVLNRKIYEKFIIYRPVQSVGNELGYMPGEKMEKQMPYFASIMDGFEFLLGSKNSDWRKNLEIYQKKGVIELDTLTYIRGRSIPNALILADEVQNFTKDDMKTLLTRIGENTKVILTGDISQIDNSYLDAINNGLTYVVDKFKESYLAGHVSFSKGERSRLATLAAEVL